jgi:hypothetical protein
MSVPEIKCVILMIMTVGVVTGDSVVNEGVSLWSGGCASVECWFVDHSAKPDRRQA